MSFLHSHAHLGHQVFTLSFPQICGSLSRNGFSQCSPYSLKFFPFWPLLSSSLLHVCLYVWVCVSLVSSGIFLFCLGVSTSVPRELPSQFAVRRTVEQRTQTRGFHFPIFSLASGWLSYRKGVSYIAYHTDGSLFSFFLMLFFPSISSVITCFQAESILLSSVLLSYLICLFVPVFLTLAGSWSYLGSFRNPRPGFLCSSFTVIGLAEAGLRDS